MAAQLGEPLATPRAPAFGGRLLASRPLPEHGTLATSLLSAIVHGGLIGGLVYGTIGNTPDAPPPEVKVIEVYSSFEESEPPPPPPAEDAAPIETEVPEFAVPDVIPPDIPPPGRSSIDPGVSIACQFSPRWVKPQTRSSPGPAAGCGWPSTPHMRSTSVDLPVLDAPMTATARVMILSPHCLSRLPQS